MKYFYYFLIGFIYYLYNIAVRKLHKKNEEGDGWFLVPFWLLGWPLCFLLLLAGWIEDKVTKKHHDHTKY